MKKIFSILLAGATFMSVVSCSDSDYDDKYADPSKTSTVGVPQVFTGIMNAGNSWMNMKYYRYYTQSTTEGFFFRRDWRREQPRTLSWCQRGLLQQPLGGFLQHGYPVSPVGTYL